MRLVVGLTTTNRPPTATVATTLLLEPSITETPVALAI
jgi:hypothetical protein